MFPRVVISIFLIAIGLASPWLVKDWMDWRADEERTDFLYDRVSGFSERLKRPVPEVRAPVVAAKTDPGDTGLDVQPYPLASGTMRVLQGMIPASFGVPDGPDSPFLQAPDSGAGKLPEGLRERLAGEMSALGLAPGNPMFLRIFKEENELELWLRSPAKPDFTLFKVYRLADWSGGPGPKLREGDGQAPEGFYFVPASRLRWETRHHLGIDLGFPNEYDSFHGRSGSGILIHGGKASRGSYVLPQADMEEVFVLAASALESGQSFFRVNVFPFRMSDQRMEKEWKRQPRWIDFWVNLKEGYDFFENVNAPPDVGLEAGRYVFRLY